MITELRIGNWINAYHGNVQVTGIKDGVIYHTENLIGATHGGILNPIKLTEEWMVKLRFKVYNEGTGKNVYRMYNLFDDMNCKIKFKNNKFSFRFKSNKIDYVHQLQNLYFSLTGKELQKSVK
jgi:hypothetical protein